MTHLAAAKEGSMTHLVVRTQQRNVHTNNTNQSATQPTAILFSQCFFTDLLLPGDAVDCVSGVVVAAPAGCALLVAAAAPEPLRDGD